MATYRFRVIFEDHDDISRDVEIRSTQNFDDLHNAIHSSIGFDGDKPSSFYMSDDNWKKGKEITSKQISENDTSKISMKSARLCDYIADPHQKIYYIFDFGSHWTFRIELIKINKEEDPYAKYPRCVKSVNDAPKQYNTLTIGAVAESEEIAALDDIDDEEEDIDAEDSEILAIDTDELPEGVEKDDTIVSVSNEDDNSESFGEEDMMDDSIEEDKDGF